MKRLNFWTVALIALFLGACASSIRSDVTRFNTLSAPRGETFIVIAKNKARDGSLELMSYAARVSERLQIEGYVPVGEGTPDLIVTVDYGVSEPLEDYSVRRSAPYFGSTYFGGRYGYNPYYYYPYYNPYYYSSYYDPFYGFYGGTYGLGSFYYNRYSYLYDTWDYRRIVYERVFEMAIQKSAGPFVFEGRAVSIGSSKDLPKVMPLMIDALFSEFPGENGSTVRVTIKPEK
jgi:Domain of unknown function (DUF4136)